MPQFIISFTSKSVLRPGRPIRLGNSCRSSPTCCASCELQCPGSLSQPSPHRAHFSMQPGICQGFDMTFSLGYPSSAQKIHQACQRLWLGSCCDWVSDIEQYHRATHLKSSCAGEVQTQTLVAQLQTSPASAHALQGSPVKVAAGPGLKIWSKRILIRTCLPKPCIQAGRDHADEVISKGHVPSTTAGQKSSTKSHKISNAMLTQ